MERLALADAVYAAAMGTGSWSQAIEAIGRALSASAGFLTGLSVPGIDPASDPQFLALAPGPEATAFQRHDMAATLSKRAIATGRAPGIFSLAELAPHGDRQDDPFWRQVMSPTQWADGIIAVLRLPKSPKGAPTVLSFFSDAGVASLEAAASVALLTALFPHLNRALELTQIFVGSQSPSKVGTEVLANVSTPAIALNSAGGLVALNAAARELLPRRAEISARQGALSLSDPAQARSLKHWLAASDVETRPARNFTVAGLNGEQPLFIRLSRVRSLGSGVAVEAPTAIMQIIEARPRPPEDALARLRDYFNLTEAEAAIALGIGLGQSSEEIAQDRGSAPGTVRQQVKAILDKTRTGRQSALAALVARLCL